MILLSAALQDWDTIAYHLAWGRWLPFKIDGDVYDVSSNRRVYGPGGSYHIMYVFSYDLVFPSLIASCSLMHCRAGKDAARAYGTGCFQAHQTHDLRGLSEKELKVRQRNCLRIAAPAY